LVVGEAPDAATIEVRAINYMYTLRGAWAWYVAGKTELARSQLQDLNAKDKNFATFLKVAYDKIDEIQTRVAIAKIAAMVGIALVSMGVGSLAEGAALALGGGQIAAFLASSTVEAVAFTALDYKIMGNDDVAGSLISNFVGNLATFGLLKAWRLRRAAQI